MKIKIKYLVTWIIFTLSILLLGYSIIYRDWIQGLDKKLTYILGSFSIVFTISQYVISNLKEKDRYLSQLRVEEYRQIRLVVQEFINTVNTGLSDNISLVEIENKLMNIKIELSVLIKGNNAQLFPGIMELDSSKRLDTIYEKILLETSKARKEYQKMIDTKSVAKDFAIEVIKMNWDISIRTDFKDSFTVRDDFFRYLQSQILL
jgi:hypothetical protein